MVFLFGKGLVLKKYIKKRLIDLIPILIGISFLSFLLMYLSPNDPAQLMLSANGQAYTKEQLNIVRENLGLNEPFLKQYFSWALGCLHGDFGTSYITGKPVSETLLNALWPTIQLSITSLIFTLVISIPLGILSAVKKNKVADYIVTGQWAKKAYQEAQKYGKVNKIASSEDKTFSYIPDCSDLPISPDADYVYICENNTIYGTKYKTLPNTKGKTLVADVSSCFLSEPVDVSKYGIIYGGVQKNIGPAGMVIAIIREDLITEDVLPGTPTMLTYKTHADAGSLYNTPNAYCIYVCGKVFKWLKAMGGLEEMQRRNIEKAKILYDYLDQSKLFKGTVEPASRSLMNVPFVTGDKDMDAKFVKEAKAAGLVNLKGHRTVGGMRASIYNAMPKEGVEALVAFMKKFEEENA